MNENESRLQWMADPFWGVALLAVYIPLEEFLLKWPPLPDAAYALSRLAGELFLYGLAAAVLLCRFSTARIIRRTPMDVPAAAFLVLAAASIVINGAPLLGGLLNLRTLVRYWAVYYIAVHVGPRPHGGRWILATIVILALAESLLGAVQHFEPESLSSIWLPRASDFTIGGHGKNFPILEAGVESGAVIGTFGHTVPMALFLLIGEIILLATAFQPGTGPRLRSRAALALCVPLIAGIVLTYSRTALAAALAAIPLAMLLAGRLRLLTGCALAAILLIVSLSLPPLMFGSAPWDSMEGEFRREKFETMSPLDNYKNIVTREWWERFGQTRLWILTEVGGVVAASGTLAGFSPDEATAKQKILERSGGVLERLITYKAFEDVFWVAMLAYYGFAGLALFLVILWRIYTRARFVAARAADARASIVANSVRMLVILTVPLTFMVRTFEFRPFGFFFWLLAGLMMNDYLGLRREEAGRT